MKSFHDFVRTEREYLASDAATSDRDFWQTIVENIEPIDMSLLPSHLEPGNNNKSFHRSIISGDLHALLVETAKKLGVSTNAIVTSALYLLIHQYTLQNNLTIGTVCNNRYYTGHANYLGDFSNLVLLQTTLSDNTVANTIKSIFKSILSSIKHGRYPYHELCQSLAIKRDLIQFAIVHHDWKHDSSITMLHDVCQIPNHPLMVEVIEEKHKLTLLFKYAQAYFKLDDIELVAEHFNTLLADILSNTDKKICELSMLTDEMQKHLLCSSSPQGSIQHTGTLQSLFMSGLDKNADTKALVQGKRNITYRELNYTANQLANFIIEQYQTKYAKQIDADTIIPIYMSRGIDAIIAMLAVLKTGAAYLPLDVAHPDERILSVLSHAKCDLLLTNDLLPTKLQSIFNIYFDAESLTSYSGTDLERDRSPNDLAYIIYTSGTTGTPNGVTVMHKSVCNLALQQSKLFGIEQDTRVLQFASLAFDASVSEIWCTLLRGGTLYFTESQLPLIGEHLTRLLQQHVIEVATLPPSVLAVTSPPLHKLKTLVVAGEATSHTILSRWLARASKLFNAYGPTEGTVCATMHEFKHNDLATNIGKPLPNTQAYVLDHRLNIAPIGVTGEIYLGGIGIARGYLHNQELTHIKFIDHTLGKLYKTNDKGRYLRDGSIEYRGRTDTQVKIRGHRVELDEIEQALSSIATIKQISVIYHHDMEQLIAFVIPEKNFDLLDVKLTLTAMLPTYMHPNDYHLVTTMPLTNNGKVDKKQLSESYQKKSVVVTSEINDQLGSFIAICAAVLKKPESAILMDASFIDQGGTSLSILRLLSRLKATFQATISMQALFEASSLQAIYDQLNLSSPVNPSASSALEDSNMHLPRPPFDATSIRPLKCILLTGSTGFLGVNLLIKLLEFSDTTIYCLIRADSEQAAITKLQAAYRKYTDNEWPHCRIKIVLGDLGKTMLGMTDSAHTSMTEMIDAIYHCGAAVNHVYNYEMLRQTNVLSTIEIIKLAQTHHPKSIHYISTIDTVMSGPAYFDSESAPLPSCDVNFGYVESKWVSEKILSNCHVPVCIYRPGNITGHSKSGICEADKNHALALLKSCISTGISPDLNTEIEMTPVDTVSQMITELSLVKNDELHTYHNLHHPVSITWREYMATLQRLGYSIKLLPYDEWYKATFNSIAEHHPLYAFKSVYETNAAAKLSLPYSGIKRTKIDAMLKKLDIIPIVEFQPIIKLYMEFLTQSGYIGKAA